MYYLTTVNFQKPIDWKILAQTSSGSNTTHADRTNEFVITVGHTSSYGRFTSVNSTAVMKLVGIRQLKAFTSSVGTAGNEN